MLKTNASQFTSSVHTYTELSELFIVNFLAVTGLGYVGNNK